MSYLLNAYYRVDTGAYKELNKVCDFIVSSNEEDKYTDLQNVFCTG